MVCRHIIHYLKNASLNYLSYAEMRLMRDKMHFEKRAGI